MPSLQPLKKFIIRTLKPLEQQRFPLALASLKLLASLPIQASWAQRNLCNILASFQGLEIDEACEALKLAYPQNPWVYGLLGERNINQKRWLPAIVSCQKALALNPCSAWLHCLLGRAEMGLGDYQAAANSFQTAIDKCQDIGWFYYYLGEALRSQGHWSASETALNRSIDLIPQFAWSKYSLSLVLLAQDRPEAAMEKFQFFQQKHPEIGIFGDGINYLKHLQIQEQSIKDYCLAYTKRQTEAEKSLSTQQPPLDILLVVPQPIEPLNSGGAIRIYHQAKNLAQHHHLVLVSLIFEPKDCLTSQAMAQYSDLPLTILAGDHLASSPEDPDLVHRYSSQSLTRTLESLKAIDFDIVCFDFVYMAQYRHLFPNAYAVLGEHNIESEILRRVNELQAAQLNASQPSARVLDMLDKASEEISRLTNYENKVWSQFELRTVVSQRDKHVLDQRCSIGETWVINNGIDIHKTPFLNNFSAEKILFFGTLDYFPNIDGISYFCQEIMPLIWQAQPGLKLCIAGRSPAAEVLALSQDPRIEIHVNPVTIAEVAQECSLSVVPLRAGGGTRLKILHSMALGLPNISTQLGCEGLAVEDGEHLLIRDEPEAFAQAVLALTQDRPLWEKLRRQGRDLVETQYDWQQIYGQYEAKLLESWRQFNLRSPGQTRDEQQSRATI